MNWLRCIVEAPGITWRTMLGKCVVIERNGRRRIAHGLSVKQIREDLVIAQDHVVFFGGERIDHLPARWKWQDTDPFKPKEPTR